MRRILSYLLSSAHFTEIALSAVVPLQPRMHKASHLPAQVLRATSAANMVGPFMFILSRPTPKRLTLTD